MWKYLRRWSTAGDRLTKVQQWAASVCPPSVEPIMMAGYVSLFFLVSGNGRRAVQRNLRAVIEKSSPVANWFRAWRVFWNFGWVMADAGRGRAGGLGLGWEIHGAAHFHELAEMQGGAILLTAHMGNYDIAAPTFAARFKRRLNTVRAPERDRALQEYYEGKADRQASESFAVRYNEPGGMLGVDLVQMLARGEVVALQGDRVVPGVAAMDAELCGKNVALPVGPHVLALVSGCPIFPLFVVRVGWRRYRIVSLPPLPAPVRVRGVERSLVLEQSVRAWGVELTRVLALYWDQWLTFEPTFAEGGSEE